MQHGANKPVNHIHALSYYAAYAADENLHIRYTSDEGGKDTACAACQDIEGNIYIGVFFLSFDIADYGTQSCARKKYKYVFVKIHIKFYFILIGFIRIRRVQNFLIRSIQ